MERDLFDICTSTEPNNSLPPAVIFDLDRTIMFRNGRGPYDYDKAGTDTFDPKAKWLILRWIDDGILPIFLTGRELTPESIDAITESLDISEVVKLSGKTVPYLLLGRKKGDRRKSVVVKEELYDNFVASDYNVIAAFDDDQSVVDMYKTKGIFASKV